MKLACIVGWDAPCGFSAIAEAPGAEPLLRAVPADGVTLPGDGPVAFRIRPLDRERVDCVFTTTRGALCLLAEIEAVVWEGDEFTRTAPLTVSQVVPQLRVFAPALSVTPSPSPTGCPLPPQTWRVTDDLRFDLIAVFPTVTDRVDAEPQLRGSNGPGCAVEGRSGGTAWATFENVMVLAVAEPGFQRTVVHALSGGGQYADGIPRWIEGEPVFRPSEAGGIAQQTADDTAFLLGGWFEVYYPPCPPPPSPRPESPLLPYCNGLMIVDIPGSATGAPLVFLRGVVPPQGPVVLRVHVHDPLARECDSSIRDVCERAIVVDAVAWTGDP
ncbi:MAG: hypothetical protein A2X23_03175 [Chloroflexi bacterium GWC2_73_18]|nr:MAG: hypothetical protein A2X23_03175 [Chloroflexi bacterium GWC2_73_18]